MITLAVPTPQPRTYETSGTFAIYADNCVLDINKYYDDFVKEMSELIMALRSGKSGWVEAMIKRSSVKTLDLPKIILNHWDNHFMQSYAHRSHPRLLAKIYSLAEELRTFRKCCTLFLESSYGATNQLVKSCLHSAINLYRCVRQIAREMRDIVIQTA